MKPVLMCSHQSCGFAVKISTKHDVICIYTVTTFKYVEGGPDREALEVV